MLQINPILTAVIRPRITAPAMQVALRGNAGNQKRWNVFPVVRMCAPDTARFPAVAQILYQKQAFLWVLCSRFHNPGYHLFNAAA